MTWRNIGGNQWQVSLPSATQNFEQLFYNQQRRLRPRLGGSLGTYYRVAATVVQQMTPEVLAEYTLRVAAPGEDADAPGVLDIETARSWQASTGGGW